MNDTMLKEIPIDHIKFDEIPERDLSQVEILDYGIDERLAQFIGDYPQLTRRIVGCWEYEPLKIIIELDSEKFYLYEMGESIIREIRFFNDGPEPTDKQWAKTFGYHLREVMWKQRMHQYEVAEAAGISDVILSRYLNGSVIPRILTAEKIAKALDCSVDDFLPRDFYFVRED